MASALLLSSPSTSSVLDQKFVAYMLETERRYVRLAARDRLRVEQWVLRRAREIGRQNDSASP